MIKTDFINSNDSFVEIGKSVTGLADTVATPVFTVTIPNATTRIGIEVLVATALGAGGAVGAGEAVTVMKYYIAAAKFLGAVTVVTVSAAVGTASALSAGAATNTTAVTASAVVGAGGVTQTFTINVAVTKGGGGSDNHTVKAIAKALLIDGIGVNIT